jgi:DNA-binding LacI/PurR family transcriptional regulator
MRVATIRDVARESGVSVATVSYVLNNGPRPVRETTRQHVLAAMRRLNYHPNAMARALASGRAQSLGVLFGRIEPAIVTNLYSIGVLQGVLTAAADCGYSVTLFPQPWVDGSTSARRLNDGRCDGVVIVAPVQDSDMVESLAALKLPLVVVSAATTEGSGIPFVDVDNAKGIRLATEHLLALGHRRIAHIMGDANQPSVPERRDGFCRTLADHGIEPPSEYLVPCAYNGRMGAEAARRLLQLPNPPTAIVAGNDTLALASIEAATELGLRVPEELSVVGFDDIPTSAMVTPALTTVRQPLAEIGERATRMLIARLEGTDAVSSSSRAEPQLVVRDTTAPPRG